MGIENRPYRHVPALAFEKLDWALADVDSTTVIIETGDEALAKKGVVQLKTNGAMNGTVPFRIAFHEKYQAGQLSEAEVAAIGRRLPEILVPGVRETVDGLKGIGVRVGFISGGIQQALEPLEKILALPRGSVHAIPFRFNNGQYDGYDETNILLQDNGKARKIEEIVGNTRAGMKGDGATDWRGAIDANTLYPVFPIAFAGIVGESTRAWMKHAPVVIRQESFSPYFALAAGINEWKKIHDDGTHAALLHDALGQIVSGGVRFRDGYEVIEAEAEAFVSRNSIDVESYFPKSSITVYNRAALSTSGL
jgi:phosphoserine phosphatase